MKSLQVIPLDDLRAQSPMLQRPVLCNGKATGRQCVHYWMHIKAVHSETPHLLRQGMTYRSCLVHPSMVIEMNSDEQPHTCSRYAPQRKRFLAMLHLVEDKGVYQADFEEYRPIVDNGKGVQFAGEVPPIVNAAPVSLDEALADAPPSVDSMIESSIADFEEEVRKKLGINTQSTPTTDKPEESK